MTAVAANRPTLYDSKTTSKLSIFSLTRLLLMSAVLLTTVFLRQEVLGTTALTQIYVALTASFFITLINVTYWEQTLRIKYFVASQLLYDLLLTSYLVYLTGVNDSIFLFLYLINILSASAVYRMQGALVVMALSGVTFAAIYYVNIDMENTTAWYNLLWNELLFLLTALLCGQFMEEIKRQQVLLDVQQENITKLQILNDRLLNSIPAGIALVDAQEYVTNVNATALQLLGLAHPPAMRMKYYELLPEIKGLLEAWEHLGETRKLKHVFQGSDPHRYFSLQIVKLSGELGADQVHLIVFQDISKMLELEKKLDFESRLSAAGELAAGIAHEIRNPLASISGSIELLSQNIKIDSDQDKKLLSIVKREIHRLNILITDFLEFAKPKDFRLENVNLLDVLLEIKQGLDSRGKPLGVLIRLSVPTEVSVAINRERLKQVFFNLFLNSEETDLNSQITVDVSSVTYDGKVKIEITDNGPGIPASIAKKVFDPFFTTKPEGTGLGLPTVAQIIRAAKGEISIVETKQGACFEIILNSGRENENTKSA